VVCNYSRSAIVVTLHKGDRVFLEEGRVRNNHPPSPVVWQKVTSMDGYTGWINADYVAPGQMKATCVCDPIFPRNQGALSAA